ncbi:hypothetical protein QE152_g31998 [Popillia japonica]|uniref:Uncharacterized protein n=1 Tax=Popillia japonica TaxID=7064 RepID=A0AAW1J0W5_POPJA
MEIPIVYGSKRFGRLVDALNNEDNFEISQNRRDDVLAIIPPSLGVKSDDENTNDEDLRDEMMLADDSGFIEVEGDEDPEDKVVKCCQSYNPM